MQLSCINMMILHKSKSDIVGILASSLCLIHCTFTPFIFVVQAHLAHHDAEVPFWWSILDYIFLVVSFVAVYWSTKTTGKSWVKPAFWIAWSLLFLILINEKLHLLHIPEAAIFFPSLGLVFLHFYNKKYCKCKDDTCCVATHSGND